MDTDGALEQGRRAFERRDWAIAYARFSSAAQQTDLAPADLELLATCAYLTGHDEASTAAWANAHQAWRSEANLEQAVRCAFWAGFGLVQRGEMAQGSGWLARATRLLADSRLDCVQRGYVLLPEALMALESGDPSALDRLSEISAVAERFGDPDLATLGVLGRGQALTGLGRRSEGMRMFDEAMVAVTAGETSPVISGIVYCAVIAACHEALDLRRAAQWTSALERWCEEQSGLVTYRGQCLVHRAQILQVRGNWQEALALAQLACDRLADPPHPAIGMAHYELAELHRLRGDLSLAELEYERAHARGHSPQPGLALLRLAQGRQDAAVTAIANALQGAHEPLRRARLLRAYVEIMLATGRVTEAQPAARELAESAATGGPALLQAVANHSRGAVLLAEGRAEEALEALGEACRVFQEVEAPFEVAQVRILIAVACRAVGDGDTAELECAAAREVFEKLGAGPALAELDRLVQPAHRRREMPVTNRELDVLRQVAAGRTNRQISEALVISEKTVERHLSNIFTKLGVSNRAAATAYAYDHRLV